MNTTELLNVTNDLWDAPKAMGMSKEKRDIWRKALNVIRQELRLYKAEEFKKEVLAFAKERISPRVTAEDIIELLSDTTTDSEKSTNIHNNILLKAKSDEEVINFKRWSRNNSKGVNFQAVPVCQYTLDGKFVREYVSMAQAAEAVGAEQCSISMAARGKQRSCRGFIWKRKDDTTPVIPCTITISRYPQPVGQFDLTGKLIERFDSISKAAESIGVSKNAMKKSLDNTDKILEGYFWKSLDKTN